MKPMSFGQMMRLVRLGDQEAAARLVRQFGPTIRSAVRRPLRRYCLGREFDPHDISQSVLATFFLRKLAARWQPTHPDQLARLLVRMAKNKVHDELRKLHASRRDRRRVVIDGGDIILSTLTTRDSTPVRIVAGREVVSEIYRRLSDDERRLVEQRTLLGLDWPEIAAHHHESVDALRKKLARAILRIRRQLRL